MTNPDDAADRRVAEQAAVSKPLGEIRRLVHSGAAMPRRVDLAQELARVLWSAAAADVDGAPAAAPDDLLDHICQCAPLIDYVTSAPADVRPAQRVDVASHGSLDDARVSLARAMANAPADRAGRIELLRARVLPVLHEVETSRRADRIWIADTLHFCLGQLGDPQIAAVVARRLLDYISRQEDRELEYWQSVGMLTGYLGGATVESALHEVTVLWSILDWATSQSTSTEHWSDPKFRELVSIAAMNAAATVGRIRQQIPQIGDEGGGRSRAIIRALGRAALAAAPSGDDAASAEWAQRLFAVLRIFQPGGGWSTDRLAHLVIALDRLANTPPALPFDEGTVGLAYIEAVVGIIRAARGDRARVAAAFFNAGVSLARVRDLGETRRCRLTRAIVNCLGIVWACSLESESAARALIECDGSECAVNAIGAAASLDPERRTTTLVDTEVRKLATAVIAVLRRIEEAGLADAGGHIARIESSVRRSGVPFRVPDAALPSSAELRLAACALIDALFVSAGEPAPAFHSIESGQDQLSASAECVRVTFERILLVDAEQEVENLRKGADAGFADVTEAIDAGADGFVTMIREGVGSSGPLAGWLPAQMRDRLVVATRLIPCASIRDIEQAFEELLP